MKRYLNYLKIFFSIFFIIFFLFGLLTMFPNNKMSLNYQTNNNDTNNENPIVFYPNLIKADISSELRAQLLNEENELYFAQIIEDDAKFAPEEYDGPHYSPEPGLYDQSEYMYGTVKVIVIFPESDGTFDSNFETWSEARKQNCINEISAALNWWDAKDSRANLQFDIFTLIDESKAQTRYEPVLRPSTDQGLWINQIMGHYGYTSSSEFTNVRNWNNDGRGPYNWVFTIFVADSLNDADGQFSNSQFAYAYLGGPFLIMTYDNANYGINNMDAVCAHETGHIFYALDEYSGSGDLPTDRTGYLNIQNQNHQDGGSSNVACIMRSQTAPYTSNSVCSYTRQQIGWRDLDADNIFDPLDTYANTVFGSYSSEWTVDNTPTLTGNAIEVPLTNLNPHGYGNDISLNKISSVQYRVNSGSWQNASAQDGSFNEANEDFTFTLPLLSDGSYYLETRAKNSIGNWEISFASRYIRIDTLPPSLDILSSTDNIIGRYTLSVLAIDSLSGIDRIEVYAGYELVGNAINTTGNIYELEFDPLDYAPRSAFSTSYLTLTLKVYDEGGNLYIESVTLSIPPNFTWIPILIGVVTGGSIVTAVIIKKRRRSSSIKAPMAKSVPPPPPAQIEVLQKEVEQLHATLSASDQTIAALNQRAEKMAADLAFDGEVIAAKEVKIAEQAEELAQLKDFITQVSERVVQPQAPTPSPLPQSNGLCAKCGFQNISEAIYCRQCGMKLEKEGEQ